MHVLALRLALNQLKLRPFSRAVVVISVAVVLLMNAMVFLVYQGFSRALTEIRAARFMTVYLEGAVPPAREPEILSAVKKTPGVAAAQMVSKDAFLDNFSRYFPALSSELSGLDAEAIPRYVKARLDAGTSRTIGEIQARLMGIKGVELVEANRERFAGLVGALLKLRRLALVLMLGMTTALLCILLNHFKLGAPFQAQVRGTLRALGARPAYVFLPFLVEGLAEGLVGGLLAGAALLAYGGIFESQLGELFSAIGYHPFHVQLVPLAAALAAAGVVSGMVGSLWATVRSQSR
jgi:cell division protein FtsX